MKLKELEKIIFTTHGCFFMVTLYNTETGNDIETATFEYLLTHGYANTKIKRIYPFKDTLILEV